MTSFDCSEALSYPCIFLSTTDGSIASTQISSKFVSSQSTQCEAALTHNTSSGPDHRSVYFAGVQTVLSNEDAMQSLCSVSFTVFSMLLSILCNTRSVYEMSKADRLTLFLMKLKTGITYTALGALFGVHRRTAARCFLSVLNELYARTRTWIEWHHRSDVLSTMPNCFKLHYPKCRVVIDCTEIKVERPALVETQNLMYSSYKGTFTAKFLIGIAPNGAVMFLSKAYGGRATDAFITVDSGLFSLLEPGDVVLADKGFPGVRVDMAEANAVLVMPPFSTGANFTREEMAETYNIASVRIHVERMIQRIKTFNILNIRLPVELHDHIDQIMHVICVLANLQNSIFKCA
ncbi:uncharacterized protein LOC125945895 isoform X1 [Dermacentor silvarum]|uniref:uncharacterized protein LOC125945895 isoform X1 n=1 Tax=Dermacentor silvarum TaxID=543639 RepID=UPI0021016AA0|nr:uncharacterized protein LOC125945895 isoform X1 [Dermacentor silvarum]XP_049524238.1 uncharacterized protein LOC125945895 isoform X1 [Dermacentor silvarum]